MSDYEAAPCDVGLSNRYVHILESDIVIFFLEMTEILF